MGFKTQLLIQEWETNYGIKTTKKGYSNENRVIFKNNYYRSTIIIEWMLKYSRTSYSTGDSFPSFSFSKTR